MSRNLPAQPLEERREFERSFRGRLRQDAERVRFKYRKHSRDALDPRPTARRIRRVVESDAPTTIFNDMESAIYMMQLCAGNPISIDAPLDAQYLAAYQRIDDYHAELTLLTPEELMRVAALGLASHIVKDTLDAFDAWQKGRER